MPNFVKKFIVDHLVFNIFDDPITQSPVITIYCFGMRVVKAEFSQSKNGWYIV
jgi:hypothetical protein